MASQEIEFLPQHYYHIYNRGNNQQLIFLEDKNYRFFLERLRSVLQPAKVDLLVYCLMPNHFHLLVSPQIESDFSNVMRSFSVSYVKSFNSLYRRVGHLYQGDFQSRWIETDEYLAHVCRYIHLNPVKAKLVQNPDEWVYTDYRDWISSTLENTEANIRLRNNLFSSGKEYQRFVMDFVDERRMESKVRKFLFG
ncbi:MAG: transposase [Bacteroidota bacterium]